MCPLHLEKVTQSQPRASMGQYAAGHELSEKTGRAVLETRQNEKSGRRAGAGTADTSQRGWPDIIAPAECVIGLRC
jgi:hypothetical protein